MSAGCQDLPYSIPRDSSDGHQRDGGHPANLTDPGYPPGNPLRVRTRGIDRSGQKEVHTPRQPLRGFHRPVNGKAKEPMGTENSPRYFRRKRALPQMGSRKTQGQGKVHSVVGQQPATVGFGRTLERAGQGVEKPPAAPGASQVKDQTFTTRLQDPNCLKEEPFPVQDFVIGDDMEGGDHSKRIPSARRRP